MIQALLVARNPGGTGNPAFTISPRFAPFPPASAKLDLSSSSNHIMSFIKCTLLEAKKRNYI
jgi:hypothetical protein